MTVIAVPNPSVNAAYAAELLRITAAQGLPSSSVQVVQKGFAVPASVAADFDGATAVANYRGGASDGPVVSVFFGDDETTPRPPNAAIVIWRGNTGSTTPTAAVTCDLVVRPSA